MQSLKNKITTDLIHTALSVAEAKLRELGEVYAGPHSPIGMLERAQARRAARIEFEWEQAGDLG